MENTNKTIKKMEKEIAAHNAFLDMVKAEAELTETIEKMEAEIEEHNNFLNVIQRELEEQPLEKKQQDKSIEEKKGKIPVITFKWDTQEKTVKFQVGISAKERSEIKALI